MKKYVITKSFRDITGMRLPGEIIELAPARAVALRGCGLIGGEVESKEKQEPQAGVIGETQEVSEQAAVDYGDTQEVSEQAAVDYGDTQEVSEQAAVDYGDTELPNNQEIWPKHVGGGYYLLPDGRKIKGKETALKALTESGGDHGAENNNPAGDGAADLS